MVIINMPTIIEKNNKIRVVSKYIINEKEEELWYEFEKKYKNYIVTEQADAFVVGLLLLAMKEGQDIYVNGIMSAKLNYTLNHYVVNALSLANEDFKKIKISSEKLSDVNINKFKSCGTGVSCGIDSFSTIYEHLNCIDDFKLDYLTFFNAGSHGQYGGDKARKVYKERLGLVKKFADEIDKEIITIDTNLNEILMMNHEQTHTIRDVSCVLNLQKLFRYYYYASTHRFDFYKLHKVDAADYDILSLSMLGTEGITFFSSASSYTRVDRTEIVSNYDKSYNHLNVCLAPSITGNVKNCSKCFKCLKTQLTLDILGKLENYKNVFDLDVYRSKRVEYIGSVLAQKNTDRHSKEMYDAMKKNGYKIPIKAYYYFILKKIKIMKLIILKKDNIRGRL